MSSALETPRRCPESARKKATKSTPIRSFNIAIDDAPLRTKIASTPTKVKSTPRRASRRTTGSTNRKLMGRHQGRLFAVREYENDHPETVSSPKTPARTKASVKADTPIPRAPLAAGLKTNNASSPAFKSRAAPDDDLGEQEVLLDGEDDKVFTTSEGGTPFLDKASKEVVTPPQPLPTIRIIEATPPSASGDNNNAAAADPFGSPEESAPAVNEELAQRLRDVESRLRDVLCEKIVAENDHAYAMLVQQDKLRHVEKAFFDVQSDLIIANHGATNVEDSKGMAKTIQEQQRIIDSLEADKERLQPVLEEAIASKRTQAERVDANVTARLTQTFEAKLESMRETKKITMAEKNTLEKSYHTLEASHSALLSDLSKAKRAKAQLRREKEALREELADAERHHEKALNLIETTTNACTRLVERTEEVENYAQLQSYKNTILAEMNYLIRDEMAEKDSELMYRRIVYHDLLTQIAKDQVEAADSIRKLENSLLAKDAELDRAEKLATSERKRRRKEQDELVRAQSTIQVLRAEIASLRAEPGSPVSVDDAGSSSGKRQRLA